MDILFYFIGLVPPLFSNFSAGSNQHQRYDPRISGKSGANSLFSQNSCWKKADNKVTFYEEFYKNIVKLPLNFKLKRGVAM